MKPEHTQPSDSAGQDQTQRATSLADATPQPAASSGSDNQTIDFVPSSDSGDRAVTVPPRTTPGGSTGEADVAPGRRVGDYELIEEVARGGMGVVYKARHVELERLVALKMIKAGELAAAGEVARFEAEAQAAARLEHPNIVPIYHTGEHNGRPYFCMRFVEGGNLASALGELRREPRETARVLALVARAIDHAHQQGILHRDLKPSNILLARSVRPTSDTPPGGSPTGESTARTSLSATRPVDLTPFVSDFGLAKRFEGDSRLTLSGAVMGTPAYIPPEQASGRRGRVSKTSDVYSLGAILYEVLTGRPPFVGTTVADILYQVLDAEPVRPSLLDPSIDRDLETICLKCLEKDPGRRYGSAAALADDLERWHRLEPIQARPTAAWERVIKWAKRRPAIAGLIALVAASFVIMVFALRESSRQAQIARKEAKAALAQAEIAKQQTALATEESQKRAEAEQVAQVGLEALETLNKTTGRARDVVQQLWDARNLMTIGQALDHYHQRNGHFPPAASFDAQGKPLLSWRVELLPDLGFNDLYLSFHTNEPWDSTHNRALLAKMPPVYRSVRLELGAPLATQLVRIGQAVDPSRPGLLARMPGLIGPLTSGGQGGASSETSTPYRAITGPATMFEGRIGLDRALASDGADQTILVVQAGQSVPWSKPDEIEIGDDLTMQRLSGNDATEEMPVLFADGSVHRLRRDLPPGVLRRLFTRSGDTLPKQQVP